MGRSGTEALELFLYTQNHVSRETSIQHYNINIKLSWHLVVSFLKKMLLVSVTKVEPGHILLEGGHNILGPQITKLPGMTGGEWY